MLKGTKRTQDQNVSNNFLFIFILKKSTFYTKYYLHLSWMVASQIFQNVSRSNTNLLVSRVSPLSVAPKIMNIFLIGFAHNLQCTIFFSFRPDVITQTFCVCRLCQTRNLSRGQKWYSTHNPVAFVINPISRINISNHLWVNKNINSLFQKTCEVQKNKGNSPNTFEITLEYREASKIHGSKHWNWLWLWIEFCFFSNKSIKATAFAKNYYSIECFMFNK